MIDEKGRLKGPPVAVDHDGDSTMRSKRSDRMRSCGTQANLNRMAEALSVPIETFFDPHPSMSDGLNTDGMLYVQALDLVRAFVQINDVTVRRECLNYIKSRGKV